MLFFSPLLQVGRHSLESKFACTFAHTRGYFYFRLQPKFDTSKHELVQLNSATLPTEAGARKKANLLRTKW